MATFKVLLSIFLTAAIVGETTAQGQCGNGWIPFGGNCYAKSDASEPWESAQSLCEYYGGYIAVPRTKEENDFLAQIGVDVQDWLWLGCNDNENEGHFVCVDGGPKPTDFQTFTHGEPDNGAQNCKHNDDENCATMRFFGTWADQSCKRRHKFVCQKLSS